MPRAPYSTHLIKRRLPSGARMSYWQLRCTIAGQRFRATIRDPETGKALSPEAGQRRVAELAADLWPTLRAAAGQAPPSAEATAAEQADPPLSTLLARDAQRADASAATVELLGYCAKPLSRLLGGEKRLSEISRTMLDDYQRQRAGEGVSRRTINIETHHALLAAWRRAHAAKLAPAPPAFPRKLPEDRKPVRWLSEDDLARLLAALRAPAPMQVLNRPRDGKRGKPAGVGRKARTLAAASGQVAADAVVILATTGIRRGDLMGHPSGRFAGFAWRDIDWTRRTLRVGNRKRGGGNVFRHRDVALCDEALDVLERRWAASGEARDSAAPAFGYLHRLDCWIVIAARQAGLREADTLRIHDLRHTFATLALRAGATQADVAAALGDSVATVCATYLHGDEGSRRAAADAIGRATRGAASSP